METLARDGGCIPIAQCLFGSGKAIEGKRIVWRITQCPVRCRTGSGVLSCHEVCGTPRLADRVIPEWRLVIGDGFLQFDRGFEMADGGSLVTRDQALPAARLVGTSTAEEGGEAPLPGYSCCAAFHAPIDPRYMSRLSNPCASSQPAATVARMPLAHISV